MIDLAFDIRVEQGGFVLDVADRSRVEVLGLFGPSGAGKTTLLETIAGIRTPSRGEIVVGGRILFSSARHINLPPRDRHIGYVPQEGLLFPHMTVRRNLVYGARSPRLRSGQAPRLRSGQAPRLRSGQAGEMTPVDSATVRRFDELSVVPSPV
jgi:molybdate transport system ATP-binding protein